MPRAYHRTADHQPTPTEKRRRKLAKERAEDAAEYRDQKRKHRRRHDLWLEMKAKTVEQLRIEVKPHKTAPRPAPPVADLFNP